MTWDYFLEPGIVFKARRVAVRSSFINFATYICFGHGFRHLLPAAPISNKSGLKSQTQLFYTIWSLESPGSGMGRYKHSSSVHTEMSKIQVISLSLQFCCPVMSGWQLYGMLRASTVGRSSNPAITGSSSALNQQWGLQYPLCSGSCLKWLWRNNTGSIKLRDG